MARTASFRSLVRLMTSAFLAERLHCSAADALGAIQEPGSRRASHPMSRRQFLLGAGATGAALAMGTMTGLPQRATAAKPSPSPLSVGIVGAGLAGLACADTLKSRGIRATIYDAADRAGGRCWSLRGFFPGQVAERGGELIDNLHKTILGYAERFHLALEDINKVPGDVFYQFHGQRYSEAAVVAEFRDFVSVMRIDLNHLSREVTAASHTPDDVILDRTSLRAYLEGHNGAGVPAGPLAKAAILSAYEGEYGLDAAEQSCLNFLLFIHADRRSKFTPFGASDERYHLIDGNDRIIEGLTGDLSGQITYDSGLIRVRKLSDERIELTFQQGSRIVTVSHDVAVLAIPFTTLRQVDLDTNLELPLAQRTTIQGLGYGTNAKMMIGFSSRPWRPLGSNGTAYADLLNVQTTWETNPSLGSDRRGILTDYSSGQRGARLHPNAVQAEAQKFLQDLNVIYPGTLGAALRTQGQQYLVHLEPWPSNPLMLGSYTCYRPGQFTTMAGLEGVTVGNLLFAGEQTNSFYEWQGFMEGAALSGIAAAKSILATVNAR
ncbi:MAG: FAD-dependent oxidoreductase [Nitrospira sp.]|nr:FAD-dependent oxidoreductase [Nitrospira sp.]